MRTCRPAALFQSAGSSGPCSGVTCWVWEASSSLIIHTRHPSGHSLWGRGGERWSITEAQGLLGGLRHQPLHVTMCNPWIPPPFRTYSGMSLPHFQAQSRLREV